jgi:hypothetical protein
MLRRLETSSRVRTSAAHLQLGGRALRTYLPAPLGRLRVRGRRGHQPHMQDSETGQIACRCRPATRQGVFPRLQVSHCLVPNVALLDQGARGAVAW